MLWGGVSGGTSSLPAAPLGVFEYCVLAGTVPEVKCNGRDGPFVDFDRASLQDTGGLGGLLRVVVQSPCPSAPRIGSF